MELLYIRNAKRSVEEFNVCAEDVIKQSQQAVECMDCEALLLVGIRAFEAINFVDETLRLAVLNGKIQYQPELDNVIDELYLGWLKPVDRAVKWAEHCIGNGYEVANYGDFRNCVEEVKCILSENNDSIPKRIMKLREVALQEHRDGKTIDFFSEQE